MMRFSYSTSISPWEPAKSADAVKIRILDLHPLPWYLRWLPRYLSFFLPLQGTLSWITLRTTPDATLSESETFSKVAPSPQYRALSYTWGDNNPTATMWVNGVKLAITPSLENALLHLRPSFYPMRIWIDQICINQEDKAEKNEQVGNMGRIYRSCDKALVWLGPAADGSDRLMDVFIRLGIFAKQFKLIDYYKPGRTDELVKIATNVDPHDQRTVEYHRFCDSVLPLFTRSLFASLVSFYKRPWFQRTWVLQEFSLAPDVTFMCGNKSIGTDVLMVVIHLISLSIMPKVLRASQQDQAMASVLEEVNELRTLQPFFSSRQRRKARDEGRTKGDGLYDILQRVHVEQSVQATQGCDMIYGLLALVNDAKSLGLQADYDDEQKQPYRVYTRTARALIKSSSVDLLTLAQHMKKDVTLPSWVPDWQSELRHSFSWNSGAERVDFIALAIAQHMEAHGTLPSWVPDWRCELKRSFSWLRDQEKAPLFKASANMEIEYIDEPDEATLALMGFKVDELEEIGGPWDGGGSMGIHPTMRFPHEPYINYLAQIRQMCKLSKVKGARIYPHPERSAEAEWRIPVGDIEQDQTFEPRRATSLWKTAYDGCIAELELQLQWKAMVSLDEFKARYAEVEQIREKASLYRNRMLEMRDKRPFLSTIGYVGMGPSYMRPGDVIVVLTGASIPFVVRPLGDGKFRLLGECYCDGIMDGEIVELREKEKIVIV